MSGQRTPVDQTEAEALEQERNRVAWNLPRVPRSAPNSKSARRAPAAQDRERAAPTAAQGSAGDADRSA